MADIVLRDRSGNPVEYPGVERIKLNTTGGETVEFVDQSLIPENVEATIDLDDFDFSSGAVEVTPKGGQVFSKLTIQAPTGLLVAEKDINFYDYDGTLLYSYDLFNLPLPELPELPDHSEHYVPLTAVGWNFTLDEINALTGPMNIGALYVPTDGETKIHISLADDNAKTFAIYATSTSTLVIDWGDGNTTTGVTAHTYDALGDYIISLKTSGALTLGAGTTTQGAFGAYANTNRSILATVKAAYVARHGGVQIAQRAFSNCTEMESITLPRGLTGVGHYAFCDCAKLKAFIYPNESAALGSSYYVCSYCYSLSCVSIPLNVTGLGDYFFNSNYVLKSVTLPVSVTTIGERTFAQCRGLTKPVILGAAAIGNYAFKACYSLNEFTMMGEGASIGDYSIDECVALRSVALPSNLKTIGQYALRYAYPMTKLTIPASVTSIGADAFASCFGMKEYHFKSPTPPTLAATSAFSGIPAGCKIYVPSASLSAYKTASNWSTYASYMVGE